MGWSDTIDPNDDRFHQRNDDPWWNESSYLSFSIPERDTLGVLYFHFRPNLGVVVGGPLLADPTGEDIYSCLHYAYDTNTVPMPEGSDMYEFSLPNGFSCEPRELLREFRFGYEHPDCTMDLTYTAELDPYYMKLDNGQISPAIRDWVESVGPQVKIGHFEQAGRMRGTIKLRGQTLVVDSPSLRDHTWGPRPIMTNGRQVRGGYPFAFASAESNFQLYATQLTPFEQDPVIGTEETIVSGWYTRDGVQADLVSGTRRCVERGPDGRPLREIIHGHDSLGRELYAEGHVRTNFQFTCYSACISQWGLTDWHYDGQVVAGENQDYLWFAHFRKMVEQLQTVAA